MASGGEISFIKGIPVSSFSDEVTIRGSSCARSDDRIPFFWLCSRWVET